MRIECHPNLFISDLESIQSFVDVVEKNETSFAINYPGLILSLGCKIAVNFQSAKKSILEGYYKTDYVSYPDIADDPKVCMIPIWQQTSKLISQTLDNGSQVIVHCVHGQSRSVSTVLAFMIIELGMNIGEAFERVKCVHRNACINPGFVAQLYFIFTFPPRSPSFSLFKLHYAPFISSPKRMSIIWNLKSIVQDAPIITNSLPVDTLSPSSDATLGSVHCKKCKHQLSMQSLIIMVSCDAREFMNEQVNDYWRDWLNYPPCPPKPPPVTLPCRSLIAVCPNKWMIEYIRGHPRRYFENELSLCCPSCGTLVGGWRGCDLDLCVGSRLYCDLYYFDNKYVRNKFR